MTDPTIKGVPRRANWLICLLPLCSGARDRIYGVRTQADLPRPVDAACVDRALRAVDGVGEVSYRFDRTGSIQLTPYRGKVIHVVHQWRYGPDQEAFVHVSDDSEKHSYINGMESMGQPRPASEPDAFMPLTKRVNLAFENKCGLPLLRLGQVSRN